MAERGAAAMRYIGRMYEVLVYVYENYGGGGLDTDREQLGRRLSSAGFGRDDIVQALHWLDGLDCAADGICLPPQDESASAVPALPSWPASAGGLRVYTPQEMDQLGPHGIACLRFLEDAGALSAELREVVIDRALAASESPLGLDDLKIIVMMVYWRVNMTPDMLVIDELCDDTRHRLPH